MREFGRVVIVGNGIAGVTAADSLRDCGHTGEIVLIGDEPIPAYSRPALSKALLHDVDDTDSHLLPAPMHGADERLGVRATSLDLDAREVALDDGSRLGFDGLIIATGCRPRRVGSGGLQSVDESERADGSERANGSEPADEFTLRTLQDAERLRERVVGRPDVIVIGGGPLGMEVASGALAHGCQVTVVCLDPPMGLQLGEHLGKMIVAAARARGLRLVRSGASAVRRAGELTEVVLTDGTVLSAHLVVTAVGDVPNVEWLSDSGLLRNGALVADEFGQVAPRIAAAGDVAVVPTPLGPRRVPLWSSAIEHARVAAARLVGAPVEPVRTLPYFWTDQFGLAIKAVGHAPFVGVPLIVAGEDVEGGLLMRWPDLGEPRGGAAVAINHRIPIPRLRALSQTGPSEN